MNLRFLLCQVKSLTVLLQLGLLFSDLLDVAAGLGENKGGRGEEGSGGYCQLVEQRFWLHIGEVWIGCKRLILKLSKVLRVKEVEGTFMNPNQKLIPL
jgi:hypothetical protein